MHTHVHSSELFKKKPLLVSSEGETLVKPWLLIKQYNDRLTFVKKSESSSTDSTKVEADPRIVFVKK